MQEFGAEEEDGGVIHSLVDAVGGGVDIEGCVLAGEIGEDVLEAEGAAAGDDEGFGGVVEADEVYEWTAGAGVAGGVETAGWVVVGGEKDGVHGEGGVEGEGLVFEVVAFVERERGEGRAEEEAHELRAVGGGCKADVFAEGDEEGGGWWEG